MLLLFTLDLLLLSFSISIPSHAFVIADALFYGALLCFALESLTEKQLSLPFFYFGAFCVVSLSLSLGLQKFACASLANYFPLLSLNSVCLRLLSSYYSLCPLMFGNQQDSFFFFFRSPKVRVLQLFTTRDLRLVSLSPVVLYKGLWPLLVSAFSSLVVYAGSSAASLSPACALTR